MWEVRVFVGYDARGRPAQASRTVHGTKRQAQRVAAELTRIGPVIDELGARFEAAGEELALVGGPVRDARLGRLQTDLDFTTSARPEVTERLVAGWVDALWDMGRDFGTIGARIGQWQVEITTYRSESYDPTSRKPDVDFGDMLDFLASDARTRAILLYIESIEQARKFMSAARAAARNKPVIVVKAGRSEQGQKAAASHTGALAGADNVVDAAIGRGLHPELPTRGVVEGQHHGLSSGGDVEVAGDQAADPDQPATQGVGINERFVPGLPHRDAPRRHGKRCERHQILPLVADRVACMAQLMNSLSVHSRGNCVER